VRQTGAIGSSEAGRDESRRSEILSRVQPVLMVGWAVAPLCGVLMVMQWLGSVPLNQAFLTSVVISFQTICGAVVWLMTRRGPEISLVELLAVGMPVGAVASLLAHQALLDTPISSWSWAVPTLLSIVAYPGLGPRSIRIAFPSPKRALALAAVMLAATGLATRAWFYSPLSGDQWFAVYGVLPVHEAMASTLALHGPGESLALLGGNLRYHWFSDAWAGTLAQVVGTDAYITLTRSLVAYAIVAVALAAWTLAPLFASGPWAQVGAGFTVFLSAVIISGFGNPGSPVLDKELAPTVTFGAACLLILCFILLSNIRGPDRWWTLVPLLVVAVGIIGGRVTLAGVVAGGLAVVGAQALLTPGMRRSGLLNVAVAGAGILVGFAILTAQEPPAGQANPWVVSPNIEPALLWSLIPSYSWIGYVAAVLAVIAVLGAQVAGNLWNMRGRPGLRNPANGLVLGMLVAGLLGAFLTRQIGYGQISFLGSAAIVALVGSGAGLGAALRYLYRRSGSQSHWWRGLITGFILAFSFAGILLAATPLLLGFRFYGPLQWSLPFVGWAGSFAIGLLALRAAEIARTSRTVLAAGLSALIAVTILTTVWQVLEQLRNDTGTYSLASGNILTNDDLEAAAWIRENLPAESVWATNRMCSVVSEEPPGCESTDYVISALSQRQALIEGYTFSVGGDLLERADEFSWAIDRIMNSYEFGRSPSAGNASYLWEQGVRYFWVDKAVVNGGDWEPFADVVFENPRAVLLKLNDPSAVVAGNL